MRPPEHGVPTYEQFRGQVAQREREHGVHLAPTARIGQRTRRTHRLERHTPERTAARLRKGKCVRHYSTFASV